MPESHFSVTFRWMQSSLHVVSSGLNRDYVFSCDALNEDFNTLIVLTHTPGRILLIHGKCFLYSTSDDNWSVVSD